MFSAASTLLTLHMHIYNINITHVMKSDNRTVNMVAWTYQARVPPGIPTANLTTTLYQQDVLVLSRKKGQKQKRTNLSHIVELKNSL